jgi:hypothetical protein
MSALRDLQTAFYAAMVDPAADAAVLEQIEEDAITGRGRLAAYRESIFGNLTGALAATYPVVERIVGAAFFRETARRYAESQPSISGDLNDFGGDFATFLAGYPHANAVPYLPDVARLEWLVQGVYYAVDPPPADLANLATTSAESYGALRFEIDPAHARIDSCWSLDAIWRVNASGYAGDMTVDFSQPCRLLILRRDGRVHVETLTLGEAALFDRLTRGISLAEAAAQAITADAGFDLGAALRRFAAAGLLLRASLGMASGGGSNA